jgi:hypothetical protein
MLDAIEESIAIIKKHGRGQGGWVKAMLDSYEGILGELNDGGHVRPEHWVGWVRAEAWDPKKGGWESDSLVGENAIAEVRHAEETLQATEGMRRFLQEPIPDEERVNGWTETLVAELTEALKVISARLRTGEYLRHGDWLAWDDPIRDAGVVRRELTGISYVDRERHRLGMNIDFIESCPGGRRWERVREADERLVNFTGMEFSEHRVR